MPYLIFVMIYLAGTIAYLFFRSMQYRAHVLIDGGQPDMLAMYALFLDADLPFVLARLAILIIVAIAIALYRKTAADITYSVLMVAGLVFAADVVSITVYRILS
ncbi:hypothetical protein [Advenella kashmirensis]|nr:hypothetical protein [Advenella kashmirensis]